MKIWAVADVHLSFGVPGKEMDIFGPKWHQHAKRLKEHWEKKIHKDDLVLLPGDISWGLHMPEALEDLNWIHELPGIKVMIRGNHDYWWHSASKVRAVLPPSIHIVHNDAYTKGNVTIGGSRLWEHPDVEFAKFIEFCEPPKGLHIQPHDDSDEGLLRDEKIYNKEIERLRLSFKKLDPTATFRIAMVHYPPTGPDHHENVITRICDEYKIDYCLYGHIHNLKDGAPVNFTINNTQYLCTAGDFINFDPLFLFDASKPKMSHAPLS